MRRRITAKLALAVVGALLTAAAAVSCTRSSVFEREVGRVRAALGNGDVTSQSEATATYSVQVHWQYRAVSDVANVRADILRRLPHEYRLVLGSPENLEFSKHDGGDTYYLKLALSPDGSNATLISAELRAVPD